MIASMTGFGRGTAEDGGITATVELRSVNNRYLDVSTRMPQRLSEHESDVQALLKQYFDRGRISVNVQLERQVDAELPVQVNEAAARAYGRLLETLRQAAGLEAPVRVADLLRYSDVFTTAEEPPETTEADWAVVRRALESAAEQMRAMRLQEGNALGDDLVGRLDAIATRLERVEARAPERAEEARTRLRTRLEELLGGDRLDPDRLEQEMVILTDKLDVTEECVRLRSHLQLFREALGADEPVGRKLNFLTQEIHREVNTIGSKANDTRIAHTAVEMKEEVEKIREQIQNIE